MSLAIDFSGERRYNKNMEKKLYKQENYKIGQWSGGTTTELAIYPANAEYLDRDFIWRLSSADSDQEESSFTKLPDFDRILMVLEGQVVLAHGEERTVQLGALEQDSFDGAIKTKCFGNLKRDYNLIMRKGCKGRMEILTAEQKGQELSLTERTSADNDGLGGECASYGFYCLEGYLVLSVDGNTEMIKEGQQMIVNCQPTEVPSFSLMGSGKCIFTEVLFEKQESFAKDDVAEESLESDFKMAVKISLGNNKWTKVIRKAKRTGDLYDPILQKKIKFLDKFMLTFIVWAIGTLLCSCLVLVGVSTAAVFGIVALFTILHIFLLRPLIYMAVLPKPIAAHVKKQSELNKYEQQLFDEQLDYDERQEKLMHKYRDRSGEQYEGRKDFLRKLNK